MKRGFTLLELLISCTLLLIILGVLSTVITRTNALRIDGIRRTTLLTQGRAALDIIADDIQSVVGTNLAKITDAKLMAVSFGSTNNVGLWLIRTTSPQRGNPSGEESDPPVEQLFYQVVATNRNTGPRTCFLYRGHRPYVADQEPTSTVMGHIVTRTRESDGRTYFVTNVVAGNGETLLPGGQKGDTIDIPVNSVSSTRIYDWTTSSSGWLDVLPTDNPTTNRIVATTVFINDFYINSAYTNESASLTDPPVGFWPTTPRATVSTGYQAITFINTSTNLFHSHTTTNIPSIVTNSPSGAMGIFTNTLPINVTNEIDTISNATFTNAWHSYYREETQPAVPTNTFVGVQYAWTNHPVSTISNVWEFPPDTNKVHGVLGQSFSYDWASWDTSAAPILALSNMAWRVSSFTSVNSFTNTSPPIANLPLSLHATNIFAFAINAFAYESMITNHSVALAHGNTLAPIQTQVYFRASETVATNQVTKDKLVVTVWQHIHQVTTNVLESFAPATLTTNNHYRVADETTTRDWVDTIRDVDTTWVPYTLIEDYDGGSAEIYSLWLDTPGEQRTGTHFVYDKEAIHGLVGLTHIEGQSSPDEVIDGVAAFHCQPLCFVRDNKDAPWRLDFWSPGKAEPPVCVDIYLEILDPQVARRAAGMNDDDQKAHVARNVIRLSRRVPLRTYNRWRAP